MRHWILVPLAFALAATACTDGGMLRAKRIERQDELIGGPTAKAKLGDYLIENDQIRAIVGGPGPGWAAGVFGGTLLDVDRQRWQSQYAEGHGFDAFAESFPLANLLIVNPAQPTQVLKLTVDKVALAENPGTVRVEADGSDGKEARVVVEGHSAYMFDMLKYLNRDTLMGLLAGLNLNFGGMQLDFNGLVDLLASLAGVDLYALFDRLQIAFDFRTEFVLHPGESFLTMRTTLRLAPPPTSLLGRCAPVACDKDCPNGYVMKEVSWEEPPRATFARTMCPVCECAGAVDRMPTFNESRDFFSILLGSPKAWADPTWKGGIVAGDFLFFGSDSNAFTQGSGYDIDRRLFEDLWQGVGTLGSPFTYDWMAATAPNVSYAWTTVNPNERAGFDCPGYRVAVAKVDPAKEADVAAALVSGYGLNARDAAARVRQCIVDRKPIPLVDVPTPDAASPDRAAGFDAWAKAVMAGPAAQGVTTALGAGVSLVLLPRHDCMPSKVMVPLFTTSATAVLTHFSEGDKLSDDGAGTLTDRTRSFTFERYLAVGDGDVASTLRTVYQIRKTPHGAITGVVMEQGSARPLTHVDVFVLADPRAEGSTEPVPATFAAYRKLAQAAWGHSGFVSQMQTDVGLHKAPDGEFDGPVPPGRYLVMAHAKDRGSSALAAVTVAEGRTARVALTLPPRGEIEYTVQDQGGQAVPARVSFLALDASGKRLDWDGTNEPELGDSRYDHGITLHELAATGRGVARLAPGRYDIVASRGPEHGLGIERAFEVKPGQRVALNLVVPHEVDTRGWVSGDFHVHGITSVDSGLSFSDRVKAAITEGLESFVSTDHDHVVDYLPWLKTLGLEQYIQTQVGLEVSPLEWGHYNEFPVKYDDRKWSVHDPAQWTGRTMQQIWAQMKDRLDVPRADAILEVNHPRDGFLGVWSQAGVKSYDLERKTGGMEMCSKTLEALPCDFDAFEILNGKHVEQLHTPTVGEMTAYNTCVKEIFAARDKTRFPAGADPAAALCGALQAGPAGVDCAKAETDAATPGATEDETARRILDRDHCRWHKAMREGFARCAADDVDLLVCKRIALEAMKLLVTRYLVERTPEEQEAYWATTFETDVGCDLKKAMAGCTATADAGGAFPAGCGDECACQPCVCGAHPECCKAAADGGTGWNDACAVACRSECHGCEIRPCTDRTQPLDDWFAFLNAGLDATAVGNSDSHGLTHEIGMPRTYTASKTDLVTAIDTAEVNRALKAHRAVVSAGPFIDFTIEANGRTAGIGDVLDAAGAATVRAHLRVQTASWFKVDRIEVYRNGHLEKRLFPDRPKEDVVDYDGTLELPKPATGEDSWYVVMTYGVNDPDMMSPVYKRRPMGDIALQQVISLGADQLLANFASLLDLLPAGTLDVESLLGSSDLPDSFPVFPYAATNPVRVDWDGGGFTPVKAKAAAGGGWELPPFCAKACTPVAGADGKPTQATCGRNQVCVPVDGGAGECRQPIPDYCTGLQPIGK